jgi:biotin-dependent carboxylase-like uncharacterized protein
MIEVVAIPPLATVQDLGRDGYWAQGLGRAGAMDTLAHSVANLLIGNTPNAATVEIPLSPAEFRFTADMAFSLVGAACDARLADRALPRAWAGIGRSGQVLKLGAITECARTYLALPGGIDVPEVLGSRSTQLREAFGGLEGRVLRAGDILRPIGGTEFDLPDAGFSCALPTLYSEADRVIKIRALASSEHDSFTDAARQAFWTTEYEVTTQSNRQGYRLAGEPLEREPGEELRSHGIGPGIVQVPGGGQPIIQLADSATMGGYPKIAAVIEPDLWRVGQARAGDRLRFVKVGLDEAARAADENDRWLWGLKSQISRTTVQLRSWS